MNYKYLSLFPIFYLLSSFHIMRNQSCPFNFLHVIYFVTLCPWGPPPSPWQAALVCPLWSSKAVSVSKWGGCWCTGRWNAPGAPEQGPAFPATGPRALHATLGILPTPPARTALRAHKHSFLGLFNLHIFSELHGDLQWVYPFPLYLCLTEVWKAFI